MYGAEPRRAGLLDRGAAAPSGSPNCRSTASRSTPARGSGTSGRGAPAGRDPEGAAPGARIAHPRRADRRAHAAEADALFAVLRGPAAAGRTVIIVTHKLGEVLEVSDNVTVLRDGRVVARLVTAETSGAEIARRMTGRRGRTGPVHAPGGYPGARSRACT